jgi:hypothetical protein
MVTIGKVREWNLEAYIEEEEDKKKCTCSRRRAVFAADSMS